MISFCSQLYSYSIKYIQRVGAIFLFTYTALFSKNTTKRRFYRQLTAIYIIGASSLPFIAIIAVFTGFIIALQAYYTLLRFGAQSLLSNAIAVTLVQELAPVLTAIMLTARAGSTTTSHLAVMRITEQIQALYVHNIPPLLFLIRPTLIAFLIATPLLTLFFILIAFVGGYYFALYILMVSSGTYIQGIFQAISSIDIFYSMIKACIFALLIGAIACYTGYNIHMISKEKGANAVRVATTKSVVLTCIVILIANYIATSILFT